MINLWQGFKIKRINWRQSSTSQLVFIRESISFLCLVEFEGNSLLQILASCILKIKEIKCISFNNLLYPYYSLVIFQIYSYKKNRPFKRFCKKERNTYAAYLVYSTIYLNNLHFYASKFEKNTVLHLIPHFKLTRINKISNFIVNIILLNH